MRRIILIVLATLLALGAIEGIAWWWMHPAPAGLGEPVLAYRPKGSAGVPPAVPEIRRQEEAPAQSSSPNQQSTIINRQSLLLRIPPRLIFSSPELSKSEAWYHSLPLQISTIAIPSQIGNFLANASQPPTPRDP